MDEIIQRLWNLPKAPLTCQGGVFLWPGLVRDQGGRPFQPYFPLWIEAESGAVHVETLLAPGQDPMHAMLQSLGSLVKKLMGDRACPERLEVCDVELAEYLRQNLAGSGIEVHVKNRLPMLDSVFADMTESLGSADHGPPSLLDAQGVTIERLRAFADAAAECYRTAPWRYLSDTDLIHVESPKPPRGMACFVVLGAGRSTYGLGIYPGRSAFDRFLRAGQAGDYGPDVAAGLTQVLFEELEELPFADAKLWVEHSLPVAGDHAYPFVIRYGDNDNLARPSKKELAFLEGLLRAIAATSEDEIDSGRWQKGVITCDGPVTVTLAVPDLLDPPSPREWTQRGFEPDRRAHERLFADMNRYLEQHPPTEEEGFETINRLFAGRSLDEPLTQPRSPAEQARELCFQSFDAHGRRRIQLARLALQLDSDCADAHVILAEQAGTLEDELSHYRLAMEAAERALGADFFRENVGHFWGISATRPYMRARFGLAESLAEIGRADEAIQHYQELLRFNPGDNQGVRYVLLPKLLAAGRDLDAAKLLKEFDEESANWAYAQALLAFRLSGCSAAATRELRSACRINEHVPELLRSDAPIPQPPHYAPGSFEEACVAAEELRPAFRSTPGALDWLAEVHDQRQQELEKLRREKRRKERAKQKKRKGR